ncbi:MAG: 4Fe-4S binding protein [Candidatus Atribacteria bacterium]|nr:4Fe-4S binding protein [Candidatus Atribacteria bacterium]
MKKTRIGKLDLRVTEFCFGTLPMGPLQANIPLDYGAHLIRKAWDHGVNFFDTAESYQTYPYLREGLIDCSEAIIATKSTASTYEEMEKSIKKAQQELDRSLINIFHLHAARTTPTVFEERKGAFECLKDYKKKGFIQAIGISTHAVDVVEKAAEIPDIDIIFPIINIDGMGIIRGNTSTMIKAIQKAYLRGKGIYAMKVLAGGHCIDRIFDAIEFVRNMREISSIAIGVVREVELDFHLLNFNQQSVPKELLNQCLDRKQKKPILLNNFCRKCQLCIETCPSGAITMGSDRPSINYEKCIACGYCLPVCPEFNIRFA